VQTFVITNTSRRLFPAASARPSHSSDRPLLYSQQLSKNVMPASIA